MSVDIRIEGKDDIHRMLDPWQDPKLRTRLQAALREGTKPMVRKLRETATGGPHGSKRMAKRASSLKYPAKRIRGHTVIPRPSRGDPSQVVGYRIKGAFFSHFLVGGTSSHMTRGHMVRGIRGNDAVRRAADAAEGESMKAIIRYLDKTEAR